VHYGVAVLAAGGQIVQEFSVPYVRRYTLHIAAKGASISASAVIADGDGNTVVEQELSGNADVWREHIFEVGLAAGTTYTLTIRNDGSSDVRVDDVWLWYVPLSRKQFADRVHARLGQLATDQELNLADDGTLTEGDYTYAVDDGLRAVGAVNAETGEPDVRWLTSAMIPAALDAVEQAMLLRLRRTYATQTDLVMGPRRESFSQIQEALGEMTQQGSRRVVVQQLRHRAADYEMG
jgi:hypothetical protein